MIAKESAIVSKALVIYVKLCSKIINDSFNLRFSAYSESISLPPILANSPLYFFLVALLRCFQAVVVPFLLFCHHSMCWLLFFPYLAIIEEFLARWINIITLA